MAVSRSTTEAPPRRSEWQGRVYEPDPPTHEVEPPPPTEVRGSKRQGQGPIVPPSTIAGTALMIVVMIMSFLACLTAGAVSLVRDSAIAWEGDVLRELTIQIIPQDGIDANVQAMRAAAVARETPGVGSVRVLSPADNAQLLEPWLGSGLDIGDLPIPQLVVVSVSDPAGIDIADLRARLAEVTGATVDDHRMWTDRLLAMANVTVLIGFGVLMLVFTATVLSVVFATRGAMAGSHEIVSVLHFIGAEDRFVAGEYQRHFLLLGLKGGLAGAVAAVALFALLGLAVANVRDSPEGIQMSALFGSFSVGPSGYFGALLVSLAIAVLTAVTSRLTVLRHLATLK